MSRSSIVANDKLRNQDDIIEIELKDIQIHKINSADSLQEEEKKEFEQ